MLYELFALIINNINNNIYYHFLHYIALHLQLSYFFHFFIQVITIIVNTHGC